MSDPHSCSNAWDDDDSENECGGDDADTSSQIIVPIEAAAPPPPQRQSSEEEEDGGSDSDDDDSDDDELLLQQTMTMTMPPPPRASPAHTRPLSSLAAARSSPASAADAAASASMLHDAMSNPPPPPALSGGAAATGASSSASASSGNGARSGSGENVMVIPKPRKHDAALAVKLEDEMDDDEEEEEEDEDDEVDYSPTHDDDEMEPAHLVEPAQPTVKLETGPKLIISSSGGAHSNKLLLTIPKAHAVPPTNTATVAVSKKEERVQPATVKVERAQVAAAAAPVEAALPPIPPTTGLTPAGRAALARYRSYFEDRAWPPQNPLMLTGREVTDKWIKACGLRTPFIATSTAELGMRVPTAPEGVAAAVRHVCDSLPPNHELSVIDVAMQTESGLWTLNQWSDYFSTPPADRTATCNVISLEISQSKFAQDNIEIPRFVQSIDWMRAWPTEVSVPAGSALAPPPGHKARHSKSPQRDGVGATSSAAAAAASTNGNGAAHTVPILSPVPVQLYCLMGTAGSYTDFHCDFGGSSVWYSVVAGRKLFLLVEPTAANMALYEEWQLNGKQLTTFLGDKYLARDRALEAEQGLARGSLCSVRLLSVTAGQTLFVPSGWIHAVFTPEDSLVFGGNFLHGYNIGAQLLVYNQELNTHVAPRFQFPHFEALHWLQAREYVFRLRETLAQVRITAWELAGLAAFVKTAAEWMRQCAEGVRDGYDAARPRRGSKMPPGPDRSAAASVRLDSSAARAAHRNTLDWAHNMPLSWSDGVSLLRELDCLVLYNTYLLEREDFDDRAELRREAAEAAANGAPAPAPASRACTPEAGEELSAEGWSHREQLAHKCFQLLASFRHNSYPLVPMVHVHQLPFLRKQTRRRGGGGGRASGTTPVKAKRPRPPPEQAEPEEARAAPAPSASGRVRQHVAKYREFVSDESESDESAASDQEADQYTATAVQPAAPPAAAAKSDGASPPAAAPPSSKRRRAFDHDSASESDAYSDESSAAHSSDEDFEADEGRRRGGKKAKSGHAASSAAPASSAPVPAPSAGGPLNLADIRARAIAAAAASGSASKKVIPAGAPVTKPKAKPRAKPSAAAAAAAAASKPKPPSLSAKQRIMQRLGLSGKLR